jgi:hypothetical protein
MNKFLSFNVSEKQKLDSYIIDFLITKLYKGNNKITELRTIL